MTRPEPEGFHHHVIGALQGHRCYLCGRPFMGVPPPKPGEPKKRTRKHPNRLWIRTGDHVWPKSAGHYRPRNTLLAHAQCNSLKGDRNPYPCEVLFLEAINTMAARAMTLELGSRAGIKRAIREGLLAAPCTRRASGASGKPGAADAVSAVNP